MTFSSKVLKGGALLTESRILVEQWDPSLGENENIERMLADNVLAKRSPSRARDVLRTVLRPRFIEPGPQIMLALRELVGHPRAFGEACYYETSRADELLAAFAEGPLRAWYDAGRVGVTIGDAEQWIDGLIVEGQLPKWSEQVRTRTAHGLLSTVRDFGVLRGAMRGPLKEFEPPRLSPAGFAYVAYRLQEQGVADRGLPGSAVWRRWLLRPADVDQLIAEAAHLGVLRHSRAGSVVRLDWEVSSLVEVAHAVA
jgi:hypothetical protein